MRVDFVSWAACRVADDCLQFRLFDGRRFFGRYQLVAGPEHQPGIDHWMAPERRCCLDQPRRQRRWQMIDKFRYKKSTCWKPFGNVPSIFCCIIYSKLILTMWCQCLSKKKKRKEKKRKEKKRKEKKKKEKKESVNQLRVICRTWHPSSITMAHKTKMLANYSFVLECLIEKQTFRFLFDEFGPRPSFVLAKQNKPTEPNWVLYWKSIELLKP